MLSKTMGLQHTTVSSQNACMEDQAESTKVLQALFIRDKTLGTTRGSVSWLSKHDCLTPSRAAVESPVPNSDRLQLSFIQDDIHRMIQDRSRLKSLSSRKRQAALQHTEEQLDAFACASGIFNTHQPLSPRRTILALEFLSTRILALQQGSEPRHLERMRSDARASCLLLLIADGDQDEKVAETFNTLVCSTDTASPHKDSSSAIEHQKIPFASIFDTFSVPAFFILLEGLLQPRSEEDLDHNDDDLDLLGKVSACYKRCIGRIQSNSYHGKVGWMFEKLLSMIPSLQQAEQRAPGSTPPQTLAGARTFSTSTTHISNSPQMAAGDLTFPTSTAHIPGLMPSMDFSNLITNPNDGEARDWFASPPTLTSSLSWDSCFPVTPLLGTDPSFDTANAMDIAGSEQPDLLTQLLNTSDCLPDFSMPCMQWSTPAPKASFMRKRPRTYDESNE